ncbi:HAD-IA family hydrolase [Thermoleophilia bacterium SCSIO 60948]|nr:HAD-IA family hydrolase [Thermoleophilia bacterium SCSIO 60948]
MAPILFGSIGSIAETSELSREAFNEAFSAHDLDWNWDRDTYQRLLARSGGADRVAEYAQARGESVDADAVHATKSELFQAKVREGDLRPRAGVVETIEAARGRGEKLGLVTTTARENIDAVLDGVGSQIDRDSFDVIVDVSMVGERKPAPASYELALGELGVGAGDCVAIEDNSDGVSAAVAAGVPTVAFPGANTTEHEYSRAREVVSELDPSTLA